MGKLTKGQTDSEYNPAAPAAAALATAGWGGMGAVATDDSSIAGAAVVLLALSM